MLHRNWFADFLSILSYNVVSFMLCFRTKILPTSHKGRELAQNLMGCRMILIGKQRGVKGNSICRRSGTGETKEVDPNHFPSLKNMITASPDCSKLTTSLVNVSLQFQKLIHVTKIGQYFFC